MDSAESLDEREERRKKGIPCVKVIGCCLILFVFSLLASLFCSFLLFLSSDLPLWNPISVQSQCKIVSSSVDIRSAKVCGSGILDYKAKRIFHPFEKNNFRCRDDYYWASVIKVEYTDRSGQLQLAWAEAPNEALPSDCRPNFGAAWLTKDKFKVNETYDCWYTLGMSRVNIYQDGFFQCKPKQPSAYEKFERYFLLSMRMLNHFLDSGPFYWHLGQELLVGAAAGVSTSLLFLPLVGLLRRLRYCFQQVCAARMIRLKRVCFFIAYFSFMGWLATKYVKRLGLPDIL